VFPGSTTRAGLAHAFASAHRERGAATRPDADELLTGFSSNLPTYTPTSGDAFFEENATRGSFMHEYGPRLPGMSVADVGTLLGRAAQNNDNEMIVAIFEKRPEAVARPQSRDAFHPVRYAFQTVGSVPTAQLLLANDKDRQIVAGTAEHTLQSASTRRSKLPLIPFLFERFPEVKCVTALRHAISENYVDAVRLLLGRACSTVPDIYLAHPHRNGLLATVLALHVAIRKGAQYSEEEEDMKDRVGALSRDADNDADVLLAAQYAAAIGRSEMLQLILDTRFKAPGKRLPAGAIKPAGEDSTAVWTQYQQASEWGDLVSTMNGLVSGMGRVGV